MSSPTALQQNKSIQSVIVIGGGLAGLAAASALADAGYRMTVLEKRPYVGGRASSYEHPGTGEVIDNCQHVLLGCCTNLIDFYERLGVTEHIRWFDRITFVEPGGRRSVLQSSKLPAPLHASPAFLRAHAFSLADKLAIARGMMALLGKLPPDGGQSFAEWLVKHRQTHGAIERFWKPVLVSALNEDMDRISVRYAAQVFRESFLGSAEAGRMGVPSLPLSELYSHATAYIEARRGRVLLRAGVDGLAWRETERQWMVTAGGQSYSADAVVTGLAFEGMAKLLPLLPESGEREMLAKQLAEFEHSPITGIHLWFDREITDLDHAVLLDTTIQWMFHKSRLQPERQGNGVGSYVELVVSASKSLVGMERGEILEMAVRELAQFFPAVAEAKLVKGAVVKEVRATYSVRPGLDAVRPGAVTAWPQLFLAGDWTATGWPATMEGAVRSGYLAAEAVERANQQAGRFLKPDLAPRGLMRLLA